MAANFGFNPTGAEAKITRAKWANPLAKTAMARCVARSSATMALTVPYKCVIDLRDEGLQVPVPYQCREMRENANLLLWFL